jgi:hypothetical protein
LVRGFHFRFEIPIFRLSSDNDVVDGNVDQLDEESDEAHDGETDGCGYGNLLEL